MMNERWETRKAVDYVFGYFSSDNISIEEKRDTLSKIIDVYKSHVSSDISKYEDITI